MKVNPIASIGFSAGHLNGSFSNLQHFLDRLVAAGAGHCELYITELDVVSGGRLIPERLRRFREICRARPLGYTFHLPLVSNLTEPERSSLDDSVLGALIEVAAAIDAAVLVLHPGRMPAGLAPSNRDALLALERQQLWNLAERAASIGACISLENPPPSRDVLAGKVDPHGLNPSDIFSQVKQTAHPNLNATLDYSHAWIAAAHCKFDFLEAVRIVAPVVGHLHIHDSHGRPPHEPPTRFSDEVAYGVYDLHLPIGWGNVPFDKAISAMSIAPGTRVTIELLERFWDELEGTLAVVRSLCRSFPEVEQQRLRGAA
jgi:sugar phosphate isomerase/epimerase